MAELLKSVLEAYNDDLEVWKEELKELEALPDDYERKNLVIKGHHSVRPSAPSAPSIELEGTDIKMSFPFIKDVDDKVTNVVQKDKNGVAKKDENGKKIYKAVKGEGVSGGNIVITMKGANPLYVQYNMAAALFQYIHKNPMPVFEKMIETISGSKRGKAVKRVEDNIPFTTSETGLDQYDLRSPMLGNIGSNK